MRSGRGILGRQSIGMKVRSERKCLNDDDMILISLYYGKELVQNVSNVRHLFHHCRYDGFSSVPGLSIRIKRLVKAAKNLPHIPGDPVPTLDKEIFRNTEICLGNCPRNGCDRIGIPA